MIINPDLNVPGDHPGRYNEPARSGDMAVVLISQQYGKRDIIIYPTEDLMKAKGGGTLRRICETNKLYDLLQYPLMFFCGDYGYSIDLKQLNSIKIIKLSIVLCL